MKKVFIDGSAGTTGLKIYDRLSGREDIELIILKEEDRKDPAKRKEAINASDVTFLCLPDDASRESVSFVENENTVILDTSTAHRTEEGWLYGFPEIDDKFEEKLKTIKRIAVPGCHASGFVALIKPLIDAGILKKDAKLACTSVTGYSGGGKKMIAQYEDTTRSLDNGATKFAPGDDYDMFCYPRQYGLTQNHKHLKEMKKISGVEITPAFSPIVSDFYSGMCVTIPLFATDLEEGFGIEDVKNCYKNKYNTKIVFYKEASDESGFISAGAYEKKDCMEISVFGNEERILLSARYDNLGKGASGAAIECLNYVLGTDKTQGLNV